MSDQFLHNIQVAADYGVCQRGTPVIVPGVDERFCAEQLTDGIQPPCPRSLHETLSD